MSRYTNPDLLHTTRSPKTHVYGMRPRERALAIYALLEEHGGVPPRGEPAHSLGIEEARRIDAAEPPTDVSQDNGTGDDETV